MVKSKMKKGIAQNTFIKENILALLIATVCVNFMLPEHQTCIRRASDVYQMCIVPQPYGMSSW